MPAKRIFLHGIDYFQLLIDHHSKKKGGRGHEARLAIFLKGFAGENAVTDTISNNEICQQLSKARISKTFGLGYPSLYFIKEKSAIPVSFHHLNENEIPDSFLNISVDVYNKPPLHIQVLYFENGNTCLLFTLHHILFDFAGVQSLIASLSGNKDIQLLPDQNSKRPFGIRMTSFFRAVFFTFREANSHMTVPDNPLPKQLPLNVQFREISFSQKETQIIFDNAKRKGLQMNTSIYFLAAVCKSLHDRIFSKQKNHNFLWVPVPVNFRRKGKAGAILFNGLSFLFYKIQRNELADINTVINTIRVQMKEQMRNEMPAAFIDFADGYRFMPMPFYYPMMQLPSLGKLSSFSFSVLGDTFKNQEEFLGLPVLDIKNYPSNSTAPGITFLFYEFRGELKIMSSWVKGQYSHEIQSKVLNDIQMMLTD